MCLLLHALALCQETLLACDSSRADVGELRFGPHTCEERIRVNCRIGAIVSLYSSLQQLESRAGLATVGQSGSRELVCLGIVRRLDGLRQRSNFS
jgi:hypothetical protein